MSATSPTGVDDSLGQSRVCSGCGAHRPHVFFEVPSVPASVGTLARSADAARDARCGAIRLAACDACGLIQNQLFDPGMAGFEPGYEVSLFHTPVFRQYIQGVCDRLIDRYDLHDKDLLEIGCGGGDFLRLICRAGKNRGVGVDPTIAVAHQEQVGGGSVQFIPGFFSREHDRYIGDFVCCLSVFEAIPQPLTFLQSLRESIGDRDVPVYFEVFNGYRSIHQREVWSIHYEQCNYFSLDALSGLFSRSGFEVVDAGACYQGDQYLYVEARPMRMPTSKTVEIDCSDMISATRIFADEYRRRSEWWRQRLDNCRKNNQTVVVWGSGGKGISFLSSLPNSDVVQFVVDVNPDRQGHFMPVSGQEIVDPQQLTKIRPNVVILTNSLYQKEITQQLDQLGMTSEILVA
jgi:hypothetical protein